MQVHTLLQGSLLLLINLIAECSPTSRCFAMIGVFLHSYPDGFLQSGRFPDPESSRPQRIRLRCPKTAWFERRLREVRSRGLSVRGEDEATQDFTMQIFVVAKVGAVRQDALTFLNEEEFYGWHFFQCPSDFYALSICRVYRVQDRLRVTECRSDRRLSRGADGVVSGAATRGYVRGVASRTRPFELYVDGFNIGQVRLRDTESSSLVTVAQALRSSGVASNTSSLLAIPVVQPLFDLIANGEWMSVPCLGRWLPLLEQLPQEVQRRVGQIGVEMPDMEAGSLSHEKVHEVLMLLQRWAPTILQACGESESFAIEQQLLGSAEWQSFMAAIPGREPFLPRRQKRIYDSIVLVRVMLFTRLVPSHVPLKELCIEALQVVCPDLLRGAIQDLLESQHLMMSASSKHRMRLFLDCALLMWRRQQEREE